jgi:hypothetical protein
MTMKKQHKRKKNSGGVRIVYNKLLGGWYIVRGPHQTPLGGRFNSKIEAQAHLSRKRNPMQRATSKWLEARAKRLAVALGITLGLSRQNPGDGVRYQILDASGSHRYSGTLTANDMDSWLDGAIAVTEMLEEKKHKK